MHTTSKDTSQHVYRVAHELFQQEPDWLTFFREVLGLEGVVRKAYPKAELVAAFELTEEYRSIQGMLTELREKKRGRPEEEPVTVITVRLPKSLHETLKKESFERQTSMNKLCIAKLLKPLDADYLAEAQEMVMEQAGEG